MKIVERYILEEVKLPIIFGVSLFTFIFLIDIIVAMMENIIVRGISLIDTLRMLSFYLPPILAQTIPMGVFLGIMITFTKFTRNSESIAMSSMGLSLRSIIKPILKLAVAVTFFVFFLQESIIPNSYEKLQYITAKIATENPVFQMKEQTFLDDVEAFSLYINKLENSSGEAKGVLIFQNDEASKYPVLVVGKTAIWENDAMVLKNADFYKFDDTGKLSLKGEFKEKKIPLAAYASELKIKMKDTEGMGVIQLIKGLKDVEDEKEKRAYLVEINKKLAIPLSTIILGVLGILLANGHHRSGKGTNFALSLIIVFLYIIILNVGIVLAQRGKAPIIPSVWASNFILTTLTYVIYRAKAKVM